MWTNVFDLGALEAGERLLVHGGSSGIGTTAIPLAKAFGASVYATAGSEEKCAACRSLGANEAFNYREQDFVAGVREATGGAGIDVILDMVGGDYLSRNIKCLAPGGRLVQISLLRGAKTEINLAPVMMKRLTLTGSTLRPRSVVEKAADRGRARGAGMAAARRRARAPRGALDLPPPRSGRRPPPDGEQRPHRKSRARGPAGKRIGD